jgi:hypothetical protein
LYITSNLEREMPWVQWGAVRPFCQGPAANYDALRKVLRYEVCQAKLPGVQVDVALLKADP